jgi:hypothetical protein
VADGNLLEFVSISRYCKLEAVDTKLVELTTTFETLSYEVCNLMQRNYQCYKAGNFLNEYGPSGLHLPKHHQELTFQHQNLAFKF